MKVIHDISKINKLRRSVVALGVFDGLHLAHIHILRETLRQARLLKARSLVVTFWPHPQGEPSIYSLEHRLRLISKQGIDECIVLRFDKEFSRISAKDFIAEILIKKIKTSCILVGKNFKFGREAEGDCELLARLAKLYNFKLKIFPVFKIDNRPVSSTYIRKLIIRGELSLATKLLTRAVSVLGTVVRGDSLGRQLGFPTANIDPHHEVLPPSGVYAVRIFYNRRSLKGLCYLGNKPTFKNEIDKRVEVYIFNFKKNIYGKYLEIQFIKKIRKEKTLDSRLALIAQIKKDIVKTQVYFSSHN